MSPRRHSDPRSVDRVARRTGIFLIGSTAIAACATAVATELLNHYPRNSWVLGAAIGLMAVGGVLVMGFRHWFFLAVGAASAVAATLATVATEGSGSDQASAAMVAAAITLTVGLSIDSVLLSLRAVSDAEAAQWEANDYAVLQTHIDRIKAAEALAISRELHNRVANTLTAISRNYGSSTAQVRERCLTDLNHLADLQSTDRRSSDHGTIEDLVTEAHEHCVHLGLELTVRGEDFDGTVPAYQQVRATVVESLTNTSKHSSTANVELFINNRPGRFFVRVSDDGDGWRSDSEIGTGISSALRPATPFDPVVAISNDLKGGLIVTIEVTPPPQVDNATENAVTQKSPTTTDLTKAQRLPTGSKLAVHIESAIPVARSLVFWLLGLAGVLTVILWQDFPPAWWLATIILGTCMPMTLINFAAARRTASRAQVALVAVSIAILTAMPVARGMAAETDPALLLAGCIPATVSVILVAWLWSAKQFLAALMALVAGLMAIAAWIPFTPTPAETIHSFALLATLVAILVAGLCGGIRALRRQTWAHDASMLAALRQTSRAIKESETERNRARVHTRILGAVDTDVAGVLQEIANGTLDVSRPEALARVERQESALRTVIAAAGHCGELGDSLIAGIHAARIHGHTLSIRGLTPEFSPPPEVVEMLVQDVHDTVAMADPPADIVVSCYSAGSSAGIFLQVDERLRNSFTAERATSTRTVSTSPGVTLIEYRWEAIPQPAEPLA